MTMVAAVVVDIVQTKTAFYFRFTSQNENKCMRDDHELLKVESNHHQMENHQNYMDRSFEFFFFFTYPILN